MSTQQEMKERGGFTWVSAALPTKEVKRIFTA
jgi:hypothetical protein